MRMQFTSAVVICAALSACTSSGDPSSETKSPEHKSSDMAASDGGKDKSRFLRDSGSTEVTNAGKDAGHPSASDAQPDDDAGASMQPASATDRDAAVKKFCDTDCKRQKNCAEPEAECMATCVSKTEHWAAEFLLGLAACLERIGCNKDDPCYGEALQKIHPDYENDPAVARCTRLSATCDFDEDLCPSLLVLEPDAVPKATSCLSLECEDDVGGCLTEAGAFSP